MVVLGHNWIVSDDKGELFRVIYSFHLPLFFFLSGLYLRSSDGVTHFLKARASSLLKPYFLILTTIGIYRLIKSRILDTYHQQYFDYFLGMIYGTGSTIAWVSLWFLPHLFIAMMTSFFIIKAIESKSDSKASVLYIATILLVIGIYSINLFWHPEANNTEFIKVSGMPGLPWSADLIPITSSLILFGYLLSDRVKTMKFNALNFLLSVTLFAGLHYYFDETIDLNYRLYGSAIISTTQAIIGIYITISLAAFIQQYQSVRNILGYVGSGSLFILIFHGWVHDKTYDLLYSIGLTSYVNGFACFALGILMPLLIWEGTKRQKVAASLLLSQKS